MQEERNVLSYPGSKQRISKAHAPRCCLCICSLFGVLFGCFFFFIPEQRDKKAMPEKQDSILLLLFF